MKDNKFRVGDWIKSPSAGIFQCKSQASLDNCKGNYGDWELWKPEVGEWCWFWNKGSSEPSLGQFKEEINGKYYVKRKIYAFDFCEPFIGELPSFLKENK